MAKGVTVPAIVDAGFAVLAERGLDGLTMRLVADRLGVKAPAIYWHLASKADLLDEMATAMWREVMATEGMALEGDAATTLAAFAQAVRSTVLRYRDGAKLFAGTYLTDTDLLRQQEAGLTMMLAQGFDVHGAAQATALVYSFTIGFTIEEQAVAQAAAHYPIGAMRFARGDLRSPQMIEQIARLVRPEDLAGRLPISADPAVHAAEVQRHLDLGYDRVFVHNVGVNQAAFLETFAGEVLPAFG